ncbi:MAG: hypothetical protein KatS3mg111_3255 [Pirellulaceae bacterium]|nr:MAG: hypothetical protein KatS3mg111_3255 [Pirellulaceae bacterium]
MVAAWGILANSTTVSSESPAAWGILANSTTVRSVSLAAWGILANSTTVNSESGGVETIYGGWDSRYQATRANRASVMAGAKATSGATFDLFRHSLT